MRIRRFLFGTLLFSCLLLLTQQARLAWAKDDDVLTVEGAITVNTAANTVRINDMLLHVDDGTYISINDNLAYDDEDDEGVGLPQLGAFAGRNPGAYAIGEYMLLDGGILATSIYVDTDQEVVGKLTVDSARGTVTVNDLTLGYDEDLSYIYIDDDDADLDDLANYLNQNPGAQGAVLFFTDGDKRTLTEVDVDSDTYVDGPISVDPSAGTLTVGGIQMLFSTEETSLSLNEEDVDLPTLAEFLQRNAEVRASAEYYVTSDGTIANYIYVSTMRSIGGKLGVNAGSSQITVGGLTLPVNQDTSFYVNGTPVLLDDLAAYNLRNPGVLASAFYVVDQTATTCRVVVDTAARVSGPVSVDVAGGSIRVGDTSASVHGDSELWLNYQKVTLADVAAFLQRNPGVTAYGTTALDEARYFKELSITTSGSVNGPISLDPVAHTVSAGTHTATLTESSRLFADGVPVTPDEMVQWLAQHPSYYAWLDYMVDAPSTIVQRVSTYSRDSPVAARLRRPRVSSATAQHRAPLAVHHPTRPPAPPPARKLPAVHNHKPVDMVGQLVGMDAVRGTLTFIRRGTIRPIVVRVRQRTGIELNAARLPFAQLAKTFAPGQQLWMEMLYERRTRVARRIWVEQPLREGTGSVLALAPRARQANSGLTLTVALMRTGRTPHAASMQLQLLPHSLVLKGRRLIRPQQIRRGDIIRFDGFTQNGQNFIPRVMVLPAKKR